MLAAHDPLDHRPRRVLVAGVSGAGKSTLALRISERLALPYTEIDGLYHGPNWTPRDAFVPDVEEFSRAAEWVTEWQYRAVRELLAERADTLVWLDLPAGVTLGRVIRRTARRRRTREVLWNGNRQPGLWHAFTHRDGIVRWAVSTRRTYATSVPEVERSHPHLQVVRLRRQRDVDAWIARL